MIMKFNHTGILPMGYGLDQNYKIEKHKLYFKSGQHWTYAVTKQKNKRSNTSYPSANDLTNEQLVSPTG